MSAESWSLLDARQVVGDGDRRAHGREVEERSLVLRGVGGRDRAVRARPLHQAGLEVGLALARATARVRDGHRRLRVLEALDDRLVERLLERRTGAVQGRRCESRWSSRSSSSCRYCRWSCWSCRTRRPPGRRRRSAPPSTAHAVRFDSWSGCPPESGTGDNAPSWHGPRSYGRRLDPEWPPGGAKVNRTCIPVNCRSANPEKTRARVTNNWPTGEPQGNSVTRRDRQCFPSGKRATMMPEVPEFGDRVSIPAATGDEGRKTLQEELDEVRSDIIRLAALDDRGHRRRHPGLPRRRPGDGRVRGRGRRPGRRAVPPGRRPAAADPRHAVPGRGRPASRRHHDADQPRARAGRGPHGQRGEDDPPHLPPRARPEGARHHRPDGRPVLQPDPAGHRRLRGLRTRHGRPR